MVFGRRGCGKTLLLHAATKKVLVNIRVIYINCEDYKQHSFPNILIEILDKLFSDLEENLTGWFGKKKKSRELVQEIRAELKSLKQRADETDVNVKESTSTTGNVGAHIALLGPGATIGAEAVKAQSSATESEYQRHDSKIHKLNLLLPRLKSQVRQFFAASSQVKTVFLALDDFYHLPRTMQPHVVDYIHRLCKDLPLYFKIATLRHASTLYADRNKQPIGIQERHDFQPIDIDFTLAHYQRTSSQLRQILYAYGTKAGMAANEIDALFMGGGYDRLVLAAGGVPRDFLSLLLDALSTKPPGQERIGKDDVRQLSLEVFRRRIEELKEDSEQQDQGGLLRGINAITKFCFTKKQNVFLVSDQEVQERNGVRELLNRLLDYRIIHSVASALTHKSYPGTFAAYTIDIGAYAKFRKLEGRFLEIDVTAADVRERCRNSPILDTNTLVQFLTEVPTTDDFDPSVTSKEA